MHSLTKHPQQRRTFSREQTLGAPAFVWLDLSLEGTLLLVALLLVLIIWMAWQWRRCLEMLRVRDKALRQMENRLHRAQIDHDQLWRQHEATRSALGEKERLADEALRMMRLVLDAIPVRVYWKDRNLRYLGGNRLFLEDARVDEEQLIGQGAKDMPWPDRAERHDAQDKTVIKTLKPLLDHEEPFTDKFGKKAWVRFSKIPMRDMDGKVIGMLGTYEDITRRKTTEAAYKDSKRNLAKAKEMLQVVLDNIPARVFWKDQSLRFMGGNRLFLEDASCKEMAELIGRTDHDMVWREHAQRYQYDDQRIIEALESRLDYEEPQITPTGIRWVKTNKVPLMDGNNRVVGVLGTYEDVTVRKSAEEELRKLRVLLGGIIDTMPSIIVGVDCDGMVSQWNREAARVTARSPRDAMGKPLAMVLPIMGDARDRILAAVSSRREETGELQYDRGEEIRQMEYAVYPLSPTGVEGAVVRLDDVTERVRMEEMMIQTEKMMSVGGLAAGMAHEINNPLAGIVQNAQVMRNRVDPEFAKNRQVAENAKIDLDAVVTYMEVRGLTTMIEAILASGQRAAQIVGNMLSFSRQGGQRMEPHDLRLLLDQTLELAGNDYDLKRKYDFRAIQIERDYPPQLPPVHCEASKIQQVLLNILKNGAEAMAAWAEEKRPIHWAPRFTLRARDKNGLIRVEIEDNGPGMRKSVRKRVFEPFFTTKPVGVGTGLGLSVSYFIITENHGGALRVSSIEGQGAKFTIELPQDGRTQVSKSS